MEPLTKRQHEILKFIQDYISEHSYAPTLEDIKVRFNLRALSTVHKHLSSLAKKGAIKRQWNQKRSIQIVKNVSFEQAVEVPLLGYVAAGSPIDVVTGNETISIPSDMLGHRDTYVLRVKGNSMIDEQIRDGDYIIVEARTDAENGDVVVALINNIAATVKKFYREPPDKIRLQPANPDMEPIILRGDEVIVQGRVMGVLRKFR